MRRFLLFAALIAGLGITAIVIGFHQLERWSQTPRALTAPQVIQVTRGMSLRELSETLENQQVIDHWPLFYAWTRIAGHFPRIQAGPYRFESFVRPADIASDMMAGKIYRPILVQFTIPEGFTLKKITDRLAANGLGSKELIWKLLHDKALLKELRVDGPSLEGFIYPATYAWTEIPDARAAIVRMVNTFWERLPPRYETEIAVKNLTLYQAVIFASLIEMETMQLDEKPMVSEVIWRRLKDKVPLAIDASLIYGIPDYDGNIRWKHLSDAKNPYNSRIHRGLPPTPIGSVSRESLAAVLTPSNMGYYYYVRLPGDENRHHFSKSLSEHNEYVRKFVKSIQGSSQN